ncbi:TrbC/VirB2 family protein [Campylobacter lanienae]|uniref:TrbC/VirB2 family protein n=1 Tax=Campylobacter lanienae TaxID=75658 RepID=UPI000BB41306|nr:TrbC/VirB2 family protein [Campylobacter lanienae]MDD5786343.1 TrbC/VirB2 family protein [Campylobacter lanienae]
MERERERESRKKLNKALENKLTSFTQNSDNQKSFTTFVFSLFALLVVPSLSFAGGLSSAENLLNTVSGWLTALSAVTVTIAILVVGYKVTFGGQTIRECTPIIIGAVLIASASTIAGLMLGNN